jgi:hypothetical protein
VRTTVRWYDWVLTGALLLGGCGDSDGATGAEGRDGSGAATDELALWVDAEPITSVDDALDGVFIPPFVDCRASLDDVAGQGPGGQVCTPVSIAGATEPGRRFADYADCDVVRTQRPFWSAPPAREPDPNDPRLDDAEFAAKLAWVTEQLAASGCTCCHDSASSPTVAQWDVSAVGVWLDTLSDTGLALFAGLADSSVLGAYAPDDNNGFARELTGVPSTDPGRMQAFMLAELEARGISRAEAEAVPPFGGPIYTNSVAKPTACEPGEGVTPDGEVRWNGPAARYVYVLAEGSRNPGVPPDRDRPEGTLWRLDVPADQPAVASGLLYGTTQRGTLQVLPERSAAPALEQGVRYQLFVQLDVGVPLANCLFGFGEEPAAPAEGEPEPPAMAPAGLGDPCTLSTQCGEAADYCALMPGQSEGYCTPTGCASNGESCPDGWSCLDLSLFSPGLPSICSR